MGLEWMRKRAHLDMARYLDAIQSRCFICALRDREPGFESHLILETQTAISFLDKYPDVYGHVLVAPRDHRENVISDFSEEEYLGLQRVVRRVGEAIERVVDCERLYVLSLGSKAANAHVHWHLVPCPPGLPFEKQQLDVLRKERDGYIDVPPEEMARLASAIRRALGEVVES